MTDLYDSPKNTPYAAWHIPQIPGKPFIVWCEEKEQALRLCAVLADYDLFQYENNIKPDYSNVNGVVEWSDEENQYVDLDMDDETYTVD